MKIGLITAIPYSDLPPSHLFAQTLSIPLGLLYVGTYLLDRLDGVQVFMSDHPHVLIDRSPDILGIYSVTQNFTHACALAKEARERGIVTVIGGPHITALPQILPKEFDFGVVGEGEKTFLELVSGLSQGWPVTDSRWKEVAGLVSHDGPDGQGTTFAGPRKEEKNLDLFPHPRREHWARRLGIAHMTTSRGCPFSCSYCSEPVLWQNYRTHSSHYVIREILDILEHFDVPHILMADDIFTISPRRLLDLAEGFEAEGLTKRIALSGWARASLMTEEMTALLKRLNFVYVAFGMESASPSILTQIKRGASIESNQGAIDLCHAAGLKIGCTFVIASPHETAEDLKMTHDFIRRNQDKISGLEINPAIPLPGTPFWNEALKKGLVRDVMEDWSVLRDYSIFEEFDPGRYVVLNEHFSEPDYQYWFRKLHELYREIVQKGEIAELTLNYLNPSMEKAEFL